MAYKYKHIIVAGTFDGVHVGHKELIRFAFSVGENVYVTITSDVYTKRHKPKARSFEIRKKTIESFLKEEKVLDRAIILPIDDVYGIAIDKSLPIDALVVTKETQIGGEKVNQKRRILGLSPLKFIVAPLTSGETGLRISSTHIKSGVINKKGEIDIKNDFMETALFLPQDMRKKLQQPFGSIVKASEIKTIDAKKLITVGDVTTKIFHERHIYPVLSVIDFLVERHMQEHSLESLGFTGVEKNLSAINPPGMITPSLWNSLDQALQLVQEVQRVVVIVDGEEDLAVLPLLLLAPIGWTICYGQPHIGMVKIPINQDTKEQAIALLSTFQKTTRGH